MEVFILMQVRRKELTNERRTRAWQNCMVQDKRLELLRPKAPDPKSGASAIPPRPHERRNQKADGNDPLEIRTPDTLIKSQVLCQLS